jgi:hypothetical protein
MQTRTWKGEIAEAIAAATNVSLTSIALIGGGALHLEYKDERRINEEFRYIVSASIGLEDVIQETACGEEKPHQACTDVPYEVAIHAYGGSISETRWHKMYTLKNFKKTIQEFLMVQAVKYTLKEEFDGKRFQRSGYGFTWGKEQLLIPAAITQENLFNNLEVVHRGHFQKIEVLEEERTYNIQ